MDRVTGTDAAEGGTLLPPFPGILMPDPQQIMETLRAAYSTWGYPLVLRGALLENTALLGLVLPGGSLVLLGAIYAQRGAMALPLVLVLGWLGMVLGTSLDYALGRWGLHSTLGGRT